MAFTKTPVNDTHNTVSVPLVGSSFIVSNNSGDVIPQSMNFVDCFPVSEKQWGDDPLRRIHKRQAFEKAEAASGTVTSLGVCGRMLVMAPDVDTYPNVFFAKQTNYYMFNYSTKAVTSVTTSAVASGAQYAAGTDCVDNTAAKRIAFLDGSDELKTWLQDGTSVTTTITGRSLDGRRGLVFMNGYLFAVNNTGYYIYNSTAGGVLTTWASTDFLAAEQYADPIVWIDKHKNHLVAFGTKSIEFFYDGGVEIGSPLVRQESYSRQIGLYTANTYAGKIVCHIDDDIYFLGSKENDTVKLYRIRNFQVEQVYCPYLDAVTNIVFSDPKTEVVAGIETIMVNNIQHVLINIKDTNYSICYTPSEDSWWQISQANAGVGVDFPVVTYRIGTQFFSTNRGYPMFLHAEGTTLYYNTPDFNQSTSTTMKIYSKVVDLGSNVTKHITRVDPIGDFGNNTITLGFNNSPNYENGWNTATYTRAPSSLGYKNNMSYFNLGYGRRMSFYLSITGTDPCMVDRLDVEYNIGAV